jgi:dihydrofolate reductase
VLISLVVGMARNRVIGRDNGLPWRLPEDLRHFKTVTMGKPILMGRKTFASIGRPLPGRLNLVLTRDPDWKSEGVEAVHSLAEAYGKCADAPELAGIGGAEIFSMLLPAATRIYLTRIEADIAGDTLFPAIDPSQWCESSRREFQADERNAYDMTFVTLERVPTAAR